MKLLRMACVLGVGGVAAVINACGGSGSDGAMVHSGYMATALVSDAATIPAIYLDASLVNPWGIAFEPTGPAWVANNGSQTSTLYDGNGLPQALVVTLPNGTNGSANPTGLVYNGSATDFLITGNAHTAAAQFIYAGEGGTISGWSPGTGNATVIAYDDGAGGAVYKGLAIASSGGSSFLYATDFHNNKIDVFDSSFAKVTSAGGFVDPGAVAGYAPFGIQAVQGSIIVSYAQQQGPDNHDEVDGAGLGYVDVFDTGGNFIKRFVSGGLLNAPWGIALAPANFGVLSNDLLIGNFGDGKINAYDPVTGAYAGTVRTPAGAPIVIPGLWAIAFGNGYDSQPANTLFFTAGTNNEADGTYGRIDTQTTSGTSGGGGY